MIAARKLARSFQYSIDQYADVKKPRAVHCTGLG